MLLPLLLALAPTPQDCTQDARVYLLAGQSNMVGYFAFKEHLPPQLAGPQQDVMLWNGQASSPAWAPLAPGSGIDFGPEVSLGRALADAAPEDDIYLIKYAANGTALYDDWAPPLGPQWLAFMATAGAALTDLTNQGVAFELGGMFWMQGESDAAEGQGVAYESNLRGLIDRVRLDLHSPKLPFVMGRILVGWGDAVNNTAVRDAQETVGTTVAETTWIDTDSMSTLGGHFDAWGQVELGEAFAAAWYDLQGVGTWTDLGGSLASGALAPVLTGEGLLWPCSQTKLVVSGAPASAPGFLAYGMSSAPTPFLGGTLMPDVTPPGGLLPFGTDPGGSLTLGAPWHPALPSGLALTLQAWIYDPTTTRFAATNALVATSP